MNTANDELDVAIVGMAGRFPGAPDVDAFWRNIVAGQETVSFFDRAELAAAGVPAAERDHPDYVPAYGILTDAELFDARFFGYAARDASVLDPQQRLFLQTAWQALESSGHLVPAAGELVGVYSGTSFSTYLLHNLAGNPAVAGVSEYELLMANDKDSLAARVAYHLDLRGPAVTVQTACSSSLVAVHLAGQALLSRECDVAIAGGAHIRLPMRSGYRYESGGIMSRDGHCRAFAASATGTVGGNGVAAVVLRRLADARRDGDTVYAVIKGSAINNDGGLKVGFPAPGVDGQVAVILAAQQVAAVEPDTIGYVEAHGTGTGLGDQIEFQALVQAFREGTDRIGYCGLGSVKTLIGHLDAAAGVAGLIKAALAVRAGVLPPSPHVTEANPALGVAGSPFLFTTAPVPWPDLGPRRRAAVSSFGVGGTNAHVVLEEAEPVPAIPSRRTGHLIVLSARTADGLARLGDAVRRHLAEEPDTPVADVAYTLQATRRRFPHRLALACRDTAEAAALLADGGPAMRTAVSQAEGESVAFLFPGQGVQHVGMTAGLYQAEPAFADALDECADGLRGHLGTDLRDVLYPAEDRQAEAAELLGQTWLTQPALFAVEYALARLWQSWGVRPAALLGHSIGEYPAACLSGVFTVEAALSVVVTRGRLMQAQPPGAMLAVHLSAAEVEARLPDGVCLAADNAPELSVVAGPAGAVGRFASALAAAGTQTRPLRTSHAFHSAMMEPMVRQFAEYLAGVELRPPRVPMLSNVTGDWLRAEEATDPHYWARQVREPVRFGRCARALLGEHRVVVEAGPGGSLSKVVRQQDGARAATVVQSLGDPGGRRPDGVAFAEALGRLWLAGVDLDPAAAGAHEGRRRLPLPTYPFEPARHWVDAVNGDVPAPAPAPTPDTESGPVGSGPDEPAETVRRIWAELLGTDDIGPHDDFFELGGHSLLGTKVLARLRDAVGVELPAATIFEAPTVAELTEAVRRALSEAPAPASAEMAEPDLRALLDEIRAMPDDQLRAELSGSTPPPPM
jgi:phthiocerol/phenolphthiocerol synthesis type-I polyketide synthase E